MMWEVMSYGERPYWEMTNQDVSMYKSCHLMGLGGLSIHSAVRQDGDKRRRASVKAALLPHAGQK